MSCELIVWDMLSRGGILCFLVIESAESPYWLVYRQALVVIESVQGTWLVGLGEWVTFIAGYRTQR